MPTRFSPAALAFLRGLARHNDRAWFEPRKPVFESELKGPMLALVEEVNQQLAEFAPDHMRPPHKALFRIYRDTRFSHDKRPYKQHIAAWWARAGLEKTSGGGYYVHLSGKELVIAAGVWMPGRDQLLAIRTHLLEHHERLRALLAGRTLRRLLGPLEGERLTRPPKGFAAEHPAIDLIRWKQWGVSATLPPETATGPKLLREIVTRFRAAQPLVDFLNEPLVRPKTRSARMPFAPF